jgi:catechol 2,3-dioxygenase-like lactoylglutathione lyase family enzyme
MLDHVSITVSDLARSAPFHDAVRAALGVPCVWREALAIGYGARGADARYLTIRQGAGVVADRQRWAFRAPDRAAFLLDPDGNRVEAVCHAP